MSERPKIIKKKDIKQPNPLYDVFLFQMSATLQLARTINADKSFPVPNYVRKFLDEFGRKAVVK